MGNLALISPEFVHRHLLPGHGLAVSPSFAGITNVQPAELQQELLHGESELRFSRHRSGWSLVWREDDVPAAPPPTSPTN